MIDPSKFLAGEGAVPVALPTADGTVSNKGVLGAFMFEEILLGSSRTNDIDEAVAGWGGDIVCDVGRRKRQDVSARHVRR